MDIAGIGVFRVVGAGIGEDEAAVRREDEVVGAVELDALDMGDERLGLAALAHALDRGIDHLGGTPADYGAPSLDAAMASHAYHLQALLYVLALHRYLRTRLADYACETHVGGYLYLFVRGVRPDWRDGDAACGVHRGRPSLELVEALDRLMSGGVA